MSLVTTLAVMDYLVALQESPRRGETVRRTTWKSITSSVSGTCIQRPRGSTAVNRCITVHIF